MAHNILNGINDVSIVWQLFIAGNEDNLDNSDHLSSQSVLSHTLLHCTYLVFVLYKDVHFDGARRTWLKLTLYRPMTPYGVMRLMFPYDQ